MRNIHTYCRRIKDRNRYIRMGSMFPGYVYVFLPRKHTHTLLYWLTGGWGGGVGSDDSARRKLLPVLPSIYMYGIIVGVATQSRGRAASATNKLYVCVCFYLQFGAKYVTFFKERWRLCGASVNKSYTLLGHTSEQRLGKRDGARKRCFFLQL